MKDLADWLTPPVTITLIAQVLSAVTIGLKVLELTTDAGKKIGRERRSRWLREEISDLTKFQETANAELKSVIEKQIDTRTQQYLKLWAVKPSKLRYPAYPSAVKWKRILLLYVPATRAAIIPQVMFYLCVLIVAAESIAVFKRFSIGLFSFDGDLLTLGILSFCTLVCRSWAIRSELPRTQRPLIQRFFLLYEQPNWKAKLAKFFFYYMLFVAFVGPVFYLSSGIDGGAVVSILLIYCAMALLIHSYARSFDIKNDISEPHLQADSSAEPVAEG